MQVIIQCLGLAQEFRAEDNVLDSVLLPDGFRVANRNGTLDNHEDIRIDFQCPFDSILNGRCVEEVIYIIIICRRGDDNQLRRLVCSFLYL